MGWLRIVHPQIRSYHVEYTASHQNCEVKRHWACLVLRWGTTWEQYGAVSILLPILFAPSHLHQTARALFARVFFALGRRRSAEILRFPSAGYWAARGGFDLVKFFQPSDRVGTDSIDVLDDVRCAAARLVGRRGALECVEFRSARVVAIGSRVGNEK